MSTIESNNIETLTDFLKSTDTQFRIFDMGRRISKLNLGDFQRFEQTLIPYPLPLLQQAFIAVLLWNPKDSQQHQIWFLKFPLDEQGKLVLAARDDLLNRFAKTLGSQWLDNPDIAETRDPLKDNPFSFTPDQEKMAAFHARASRLLKQPASPYYQPARDYMSGLKGYNHWNEVGLQGIADMVARYDEEQNEAVLSKAIADVPAQPLEAICINLEHDPISHKLAGALQQRLHSVLDEQQSSANTLGALIRAIAQSPSEQQRREAILQVLNSRFGAEIEVLAAIASRAWQDLEDDEVRRLFLDKLAINSAGQISFNLMIRDLLFMPGLRAPIMESFRNPERSEDLGRAIGAFFSGGATQH